MLVGRQSCCLTTFTARSAGTRAVRLQPVPAPSAEAELWDYLLERLRAYLLDSASAGHVPGVTTEMFDAVRASSPVSPLDFRARLEALVKFLALPEAASLTAANKRISNILKKAPADQGGAGGARRADGAKDIGPCVAGIARRAGAGSPLGPSPGERPLLAHARLVLT